MKKIANSFLLNSTKKDYTKTENSNPKTKIILTRDKKQIMNKDYFHVEKVREGGNLEDISTVARRENRKVDRLYQAYIDLGFFYVSYKDYPDKYNRGWIDSEKLGKAKKVSLSFDGRWARRGDKWELKTEKEPFLFLVDNKVLYYQKWKDETSRKKLADDVVEISSIRAWQSVARKEDDNGLIVAYIKTNGSIFYRTYAYQKDVGFVFEAEKKIDFTGKAKKISLFITPDYRTGIMITSDTDNIYYKLSYRNWAGMGIRGENLLAICKTKIDFKKIKSYSTDLSENLTAKVKSKVGLYYGKTDNKILRAENLDNKKIKIEVLRDIQEVSPNGFKLVDKNNNIFLAESIQKHDDYTMTISFADFNNADPTAKVYITGLGAKNILGNNYLETYKDILLTGLVPVIKNPPTMSIVDTETIKLIFDSNFTINGTDYRGLEITGKSYKSTLKNSFIISKHDVLSISKENQNTLLIKLKKESRLKSNINVNLKYTGIGSLLSWTKFEINKSYIVASNKYFSNIESSENLKANLSYSIELKEIKTLSTNLSENLKASVKYKIEFKKIASQNP